MEYRSKSIHQRPYSKALVKSCGVIDEELRLPLVAVINSWNELHPGHIHLRSLADAVKAGIRIAGGNPFESNTIALCDGIRSPQSNKYILPSREIITDSIEVVAQTYQVDGLVLISSCDKIEPANLMAAARVDVPTIIVTGGAMVAGVYRGRQTTEDDMDVAGSGYRDGEKVPEKELYDLVEAICETPGGCFGMGTANTMACLIEAMGMSLPECACTLAVESKKMRIAKKTGIAIMNLISNNIRPSDIMTKPSLLNALRVNEAIGGSTNTYLHIPALAHELGIDIQPEEYDEISRTTPHLCDIMPSGKYSIKEMRDAGGIPALLQEMKSLVDMDAITVTGTTLGESFKNAENYNRNIIRPLSNPIHTYGGHAVLKGNIAPGGCVIKQTACPEKLRRHEGPARVFDDGDLAMDALREGRIKKGDVIVIRYEGPKGGPGMREMVDLTRTIFALNLIEDVAVITDGRFSGYSRGAVFGHVSPEAQTGGPIAAIREGDIIQYDIDKRTIAVQLDESEIHERLASWSPKENNQKGYLKRYSQSVSSAIEGAILQ